MRSESNFLALPPELSDPDGSRVMILPLPLDLTCSWEQGTAAGPGAIIEASTHIEYYDEELGFETAVVAGGIATLPEPALPDDPAMAADTIESLAAGLIGIDRFLLSLGGEHSVTWPLVKAHRDVWPNLCVLQIDAHADLRDTYHGSPFNHACPMRRIRELEIPVTAVGIRSSDVSEVALLDDDLHSTFMAYDVAGRLVDRIDDIMATLTAEHIYITIDLDGLDPSVIPAVGTPVPGGLGWYETLDLLRAVCGTGRVVGADVVELSPRQGLHHADAAAARLVNKMIGYRVIS
ncbi:agmatinase [Candidatus Zixiibacteriota bacterium]